MHVQVVSLLPCGVATSSLVLAQAEFGDIGFISRLGLAAIFLNIINGGISGHFFTLIAIFRLCQICGAKITDKVDLAVRLWVSFC